MQYFFILEILLENIIYLYYYILKVLSEISMKIKKKQQLNSRNCDTTKAILASFAKSDRVV